MRVVTFLLLLFCADFSFASDCENLFTKDYLLSIIEEFLHDEVLTKTMAGKTPEELGREVNEFLRWWNRTHSTSLLLRCGDFTDIKKLIIESTFIDKILTKLQKELAAHKDLAKLNDIAKIRMLVSEYTEVYWGFVVLSEYRKRVLSNTDTL